MTKLVISRGLIHHYCQVCGGTREERGATQRKSLRLKPNSEDEFSSTVVSADRYGARVVRR